MFGGTKRAERLEGEGALQFLRWVLISALAYMILLGESGPATKPTHLLYIGALLASNIIMPRIPYRNPQTFGSSLLAIDTVLVLVGVMLCDSASQDLLIAYFLCIIVATFADSQRRIALAAALVTGVYSFWLFPHFHALDHAALLIRLPFLFIVTVFYGYMILRIRDEHARRLEAEDRLLGVDCLLRATRLFSSSLVSSEILEQVSSIIRSAVRVDRCEFHLVRRGVAALQETASSAVERTGATSENGRPAAEIALPIVHDGEPFGTLVLEDARGGRRFSPAEIAFCEVIANTAAAALKNAQQYEALCELDRGRTEFLANFSHELRTPLNVILGFSEMLGEELAERGSEDARDMASRISANAVRLSKHVENLIDLSVATFGRDVPTIARVDLAGMLHRLASSAADEGRARVAVALEMAPEVGAIFTDGQKLERVVGNLLSNAVKFTDAGSVTLRAKLLDSGDEGEAPAPTHAEPWERVLSLSVTDTGVGIDPVDITRVLRGFNQASHGPGRRYAGLGIGLDVARKLARSLGGQIHVKSTPRQGSEFEVLVPVLLAA